MSTTREAVTFRHDAGEISADVMRRVEYRLRETRAERSGEEQRCRR
jgi:hypothetical protein